MNSEIPRDLAFLTLSFKYFFIVENSLNETIKQGNLHILISDTETFDYHERTKWSDFNILTPALFCLYHGLELLMKGLALNQLGKFEEKHNLVDLCRKIDKSPGIPKRLRKLLTKYVFYRGRELGPIRSFLRANRIANADGLYAKLRYPIKGLDVFSYLPLKYRGSTILPLFRAIVGDLAQIRLQTVKLYYGK